MKKLFAVMISAIMVLSMSITAFAAETITEQNGSKDIDVKAQAIYINPDNVYVSSVAGDKAAVSTKNNVTVSVSTDGTALDGLTLNIIEMVKEDNEAYSWISGIMSGLCNKFAAYDIYFTDKDGNRVDVTASVTVSITTPDGYTNVQVYHIGSSASPDEIDSKQIGENTQFTANGFSYYVLAEKTNESGGSDTTNPTNPSNPDKPIDPNSPQTGDNSNMTLWLTLLFVSGGVLTIFCISNKRRKQALEK